ncbi:MAG TPA: hypothetical protein VG184_06090 [Acidimicrobiales bacterium]|jgi:uncharacterized membrane protein (DUF2068 family)|nr:hypothetical protein [Acidimicrobiales bacterium]
MPASRWLDRTQPQTLMIATILLYLNAVLGLIDGEMLALVPLGALLVVSQGVAGWGIANQKKWAYWLGIAAVVATIFVTFDIVNLIFQVALVALLIHPQSREYKRTWFR